MRSEAIDFHLEAIGHAKERMAFGNATGSLGHDDHSKHCLTAVHPATANIIGRDLAL